MATNEEIIREIKDLKLRLYGEQNDPGDIPAIRSHCERQNGQLADHERRIIEQEVYAKVAAKEREKISEKINNRTEMGNLWQQMNRKQKFAIGGPTVGMIIAIIFAIGESLGWW